MKTLIIITLLIIIPLTINSQQYFNSYLNQYSNKSYQIKLSQDDNDLIKYRLYVDMISIDTLYNSYGGIVMNSDQHNEFLFQLNEAKLLYNKYSNLCRINEISDWTNMMQISPSVSVYYKNDKNVWMVKNNVDLTFYFKRMGNESFLIISTDYVNNEKISIEENDLDNDTNIGFLFIFPSLKEINEFIELINIDNVSKELNKNNLSEIN